MSRARRSFAALSAAALLSFAGEASAGNGPGLGDPLPSPIVATAVRDRVPSFRDPGLTYVLVFLDTSSPEGMRAIPVLDRIARAHGGRVAVTSIHEDPVPTVREFADHPEWSAKLSFTVAADPMRNALQTVFGPNSWPRLPVAFVVRGGVVQWRGVPAELEPVVARVVSGAWDLGAAKRADEQRRLWDSELERIDALARAGHVDEAIKALDDACKSAMSEQLGECTGRKFQMLVDAGRADDALAVGEAIIRAPANAKQPAGVAWSIAKAMPADQRVLEFALRAAGSSDRSLGGKDPMVAGILARIQFLAGRDDEARETARRALSLADAPDMRAVLEQDLRNYSAVRPRRRPDAPGPR